MHARKRVRFSEDELETAINPNIEADHEIGSRATLLPEPDEGTPNSPEET